jgi:hypothetical protein
MIAARMGPRVYPQIWPGPLGTSAGDAALTDDDDDDDAPWRSSKGASVRSSSRFVPVAATGPPRDDVISVSTSFRQRAPLFGKDGKADISGLATRDL